MLFVGGIFLLPAAIGIFFLVRKRKTLVAEITLPSGEACVDKINKAMKKAKIALCISLAMFGLGICLAVIGGVTGMDALLFAGILTAACGFFVLAAYSVWAPTGAAKKLLEKEGISLDEVALDLDKSLFLAENVRCGRKVLLLNNAVCLPLSSIVWIYPREVRSRYGIVVGRYTVIRTAYGKKLEIPATDDDFNTIPELLKACGPHLSPDLMVGYNRDTRKRYKALLQAKKAQ